MLSDDVDSDAPSSSSRWLAIGGGGSGNDASDYLPIALEEISSRAERLVATKSSLPSSVARGMSSEIRANRWDANKNPAGKIDLSTDETNLSQTLLGDKLETMRFLLEEGTLHCTVRALQQLPEEKGNERVKSAVASHIRRSVLLQNSVSVDIQSDRIVIVPGINAAYDMLAFTLFSRGDVILCPAAYTSRLCDNFEEKAGVEGIYLLASIQGDLREPKLDIDSFETVYEHAVSQVSLVSRSLMCFRRAGHLKGQTVRAIAISNPHIHLGVLFSSDELVPLLEWAITRGVWIIADESLASTYEEQLEPHMAATTLLPLIEKGEKAAEIRRCLIWLYDMGEELSLHGLHFTSIYTHSERVREVLEHLTLAQPCAPLVQLFAKELLNDFEWITKFRKGQSGVLNENRRKVLEWLDRMEIPCCKPRAGRWIFLDLREVSLGDFQKSCGLHHYHPLKFLPAPAMFREEEHFWRKLYGDVGVRLCPGENFGLAEAGWFCLALTRDRLELEEGLQRLETYFVVQRQLSKADGVRSPSDTRRLKFPHIGHFSLDDNAEELVVVEELDFSLPSPQTPPRIPLANHHLTSGSAEKRTLERRRASFSSLADDDEEERVSRLGVENQAPLEEVQEEEEEQRKGSGVGRMSSEEEAGGLARNLSTTSMTDIDWSIYGRPKDEDTLERTPSSSPLSISADPELPPPSTSPTVAAGSDTNSSAQESAATPPSDSSSPVEGPKCNLLYLSELGSQRVTAYDDDELLREVFSVFPKERLQWTEWDVDGNKVGPGTDNGSEPVNGGGARHRKLSREALERRAQLAKRIRWASEQRQASSRQERPKTLLLPPMSNAIREQKAQRERVKKLSAISEASNETMEELRARERHLSLDLSPTSSSILGEGQEEIDGNNKCSASAGITPPLIDFKFISEIVYGASEEEGEGELRLDRPYQVSKVGNVDGAEEEELNQVLNEVLDGFDEILKSGLYAEQTERVEAVEEQEADGGSVEEFHPIPLTIEIPLVCDRVGYINNESYVHSEGPDRHIMEIINRLLPTDTSTSTQCAHHPHNYHQLTRVEELEEQDHSDRHFVADLEELARTDSGLALSPLSISVHDSNSLPRRHHLPELTIPQCSEPSSSSTTVQLSPRLDKSGPDVMDDSGVFVEFRPGSISVDFPLVVSMDLEGATRARPQASLSGDAFTEDDLWRLVADGISLPTDASDAVRELSGKIGPPRVFLYDGDPHLKKCKDLTWESLEAESWSGAGQRSVELADGSGQFQNAVTGVGLTEAELLAALSEGSSFCAHPKVSIGFASEDEDDDEGKGSEMEDSHSHVPATLLDTEAVSTTSVNSKTSLVPKWEPLESLNAVDGSETDSQREGELVGLPSPLDATRQKKFSDELDLYERQVDTTEGPHSVVEHYNEWVNAQRERKSELGEEVIHAELQSTLSSSILATASIVVEQPLRASDQFGRLALDIRDAGRGKKRSDRPSVDSHFEPAAEVSDDVPSAAPVESEDGLGIPVRSLQPADESEVQKEVTGLDKSARSIPLPGVTKDNSSDIQLPSRLEESRYWSYDYIVEREHIYPLPHSEHQLGINRQWDYRRPIEELFPSIRVSTTHPCTVDVGESADGNGRGQSYRPPPVMHRILMNRKPPAQSNPLKELVVEHIDVTEISCISHTQSESEMHRRPNIRTSDDTDRIEYYDRRDQGRSKSYVEVDSNGNYGKRCFESEKVPESSSWRNVPIRLLGHAREEKSYEKERAAEPNEEGATQQEYLICRNPIHVHRGDHCDPRCLYIIQRSTMRHTTPQGKAKKEVKL